MLAERGVLRPGLSIEDGSAILWTLCSLAVFDLFVTTRGWSAERYQAWLARSLIGQLLPELEP